MAQENDPRQTVIVNHHGSAALGSETLVDIFFGLDRGSLAVVVLVSLVELVRRRQTLCCWSLWGKESEGADRDGTLRLRRSTLDGADNLTSCHAISSRSYHVEGPSWGSNWTCRIRTCHQHSLRRTYFTGKGEDFQQWSKKT